MKALTPSPTPNVSQEPLITRELTFRNSTFGALKTFMRQHKRRTGETLSNAAAVDMILRAHLARHIHPDAVKTMHSLSSPATAHALRALETEDLDGSPVTPATPQPPRGDPTIKVTIPTGRRSFVRPSGDVTDDPT